MAQGKYGTESRPLESVTTDRVAYEPLTSDPSETYKGSSWFRDDLDGGDKIGTLRFQNDDDGNDIFDIPVFAESESVNGVVKVRAIQTADGEGFIPMVEEGGEYPEWRFQNDGTWYGAHNALSEFGNVIDNFEDYSNGPYQQNGETLSDFYGGDLGSFSRQQSTVLAGSYTLEGVSLGADGFVGISSISGLPKYPQRGETFRVRFEGDYPNTNTGEQVRIGWLTGEEPTDGLVDNTYAVTFASDSGTGTQLTVRDGGSRTVLDDDTTVAASANTTYEYQISHTTDGNILVKILEDSVAERAFDGQVGKTLAAVDTSHTSGGIWHFVNGAADPHTALIDEFRTVESWIDYRSFNANNPLITPSDNPDASEEQYTPAVIEKPSGGYAMYVKSDELADGDFLLRLWESADGVSWTRQSTTIGPSDVSASGAETVSSPAFLYNPDDSTYYLWANIGMGSDPDPTYLFTGSSHDNLSEASANPILSPSDVGFANTDDVLIQDVLTHDGTTYCYGTHYGTDIGLWYGTMADYGSAANPQGDIASRATAYESGDVIQVPAVFQRGDGDFVVTFAVGDSTSSEYDRQMYSAVGSSPTSFNPVNDIFIPAKSGSWRSRWAYGGDWLKVNDGENKTLQTVNGNYRFYFNGQPTSSSNDGSVGLAEFSGIANFDP